MSNDSEKEWAEVKRFLAQNKITGFIGIGILALLLGSTLFGLQALYIGGAIAIAGLYFAYTKEFENFINDNQPTLAAAALGFFISGSNPLGAICGALLGYSFHQKIRQATSAVNTVASTVGYVVSPALWLKDKTTTLAVSAGTGVKNATKALITGTDTQPSLLNKGTTLIGNGLSAIAEQYNKMLEEPEELEPAPRERRANKELPPGEGIFYARQTAAPLNSSVESTAAVTSSNQAVKEIPPPKKKRNRYPLIGIM